jgi:hypothetical protein
MRHQKRMGDNSRARARRAKKHQQQHQGQLRAKLWRLSAVMTYWCLAVVLFEVPEIDPDV